MAKFFWLTGLSGAGKTTIGQELYQLLKKHHHCAVFFDGDTLREVLGEKQEYTRQARLKLALTYARLAKMLTSQGIDVVCCTISLLKEIYAWNRENIQDYVEIYIRVPKEILIQRDRNQLYSRALKGEIKDVMGIDIPFDEPRQAHSVVDNTGEETPQDIAKRIFKQFYKEVS